jgi:hypothetical protein
MTVASADVRRSRSGFSTRRVSRLHSSPAREELTVQGRAGVYCPGGAENAFGGARNAGPGAKNRPPLPEIRNRADGTLVRYCALASGLAIFGGRQSAVRVMPRERAAIRTDVLGRATVGPLSLALSRLPDRGSALSPSPSASRPRLASGLLPRRPVLVAGVPAPGC